jgi:hypothetical protein
MTAAGGEESMRKYAPAEGRASASAERPDRRHPIDLPPTGRFNRSPIIFVTVRTARGKQILALTQSHFAIVDSSVKASRRAVRRYVILPDPIHFLSAPNELEAPSLERWMRSSCYPQTRVASGKNLAATPLGSATPARRKLRREMGICPQQSGAAWIGNRRRRMASLGILCELRW